MQGALARQIEPPQYLAEWIIILTGMLAAIS